MAPKIKNHVMQEISKNLDYTRYESSFNNRMLVISVIEYDDGESSSYIRFNDHPLFNSSNELNSQIAADKATNHLDLISNLLKNLGFGL